MKMSRFSTNLLANGYAQLCTVAVQFLAVPLFLSKWGAGLYGEWLVISALPTYLALSDSGFSTVVVNDIAMSSAKRDAERLNMMLATLAVFMVVVMVICCAAGLALTWSLPLERLLLSNQLQGIELRYTLSLLLVYTALMMGSMALNACYRAVDNYALGMVVLNTLRLADLGAIVTVLLFHGSPFMVATGLCTVRFLASTLACIDAWQRLRKCGLRPILPLASRSYFLSMLRPSLAFMSFGLGNSLFMQGGTLLVNAILGPVAVAVFASARTLTRAVSQVSNIIKNAGWPELSRLHALQDMAGMRRVNRRVFTLSFWGSSAGSILMLLLGDWIMHMWSRGHLSIGRTELILLVAGVLANAVWSALSCAILAVNKHEGFALRYVVCCASIVPLSWLLGLWTPENAVPAAMLLCELSLLVPALSEAAKLTGDSKTALLASLFGRRHQN